MFISEAYAQAGGQAGGMDALIQGILPMILIFAVFYFLLIRPQQRRNKEHKQMLDALRRGDKIVTNGGLIGTVAKVVDGEEVQVDIAEGVRVRVMRQMIAQVMSKTEPVRPANSDGGPSDGGGMAGGLKKLLGGK